MGLFFKSMLILLIAVSTPLIYRQFANDNTIKFMSSYYSNYKSIDSFLRRSANHIDAAKDYLPDSGKIKNAVDQLQHHIQILLPKSVPEEKKVTASQSVKTEKEEVKVRFAQCQAENLQGKQIRLWNKQELAKYDGSSESETDVYLGFLGLVYNVTLNAQHYAKGAEYNAFAGRDATRAFVTGNFTHDLNDDIQDIDSSLFSHIESWANFYQGNYPVLGRIEGRFFDSQGCGTKELAKVYQTFKKLETDKENRREQEREYPECNSEWNSDIKKGRVWCSTKSGGVERSWVGVPRIYKNGESNRCACFNQDAPEAAELAKFMSIYPGCDPKASECSVMQ